MSGAFKPGFDPRRNLKGRLKKGCTLTDILASKVKGCDLAKALVELMASEEPSTRLSAIKYIYDRIDGKPIESVKLGGPDGGPLVITEIVIKKRSDDSDGE